LLAQQITQSSGQGFEVEYRPGAGTIKGTEAVAKAAADGTTLLDHG
jgi:tripartite-type tricarboxylate transporter receptor subunit TctC